MNKSTVGVAAIALLTGFLVYAAYFDYKRRSDATFRKKLKKSRKRAQKAATSVASTSTAGDTSSAATTADPKVLIERAYALANISEQSVPKDPVKREEFFMEEVQCGENALAAGLSLEQAAAHFYRALIAYPNAVELVMIYQKTVPEPVFNIILGLMSKDMQLKQERYYELFPPASMHAKLELIEDTSSAAAEIKKKEGASKIVRRALVTTKAWKAGATVLNEEAVVVALEPSLEGMYCHHCLQKIDQDRVSCDECDEVGFCSKACGEKAKATYHPAMCTRSKLDGTFSGVEEKAMNAARELWRRAKEEGVKIPLMLTRLFAQQVAEEKRRVEQGAESPEEFGVWEHIEKLRFMNITPNEAEEKERLLVIDMLAPLIPGIETFVTEERYLTLKGKLTYNMIAIHANLDSGVARPTSSEYARGDDERPVLGAGLYIFSAYARHSCHPNALLRFNNPDKHQTRVSLVATRDILEKEELNVAWIPIKDDGNVEGVHGSSIDWRRMKLATGYRFKCECERCVREDKESLSRSTVLVNKEDATVDVGSPAVMVSKADSPVSLADSGEMVDLPESSSKEEMVVEQVASLNMQDTVTESVVMVEQTEASQVEESATQGMTTDTSETTIQEQQITSTDIVETAQHTNVSTQEKDAYETVVEEVTEQVVEIDENGNERIVSTTTTTNASTRHIPPSQ